MSAIPDPRFESPELLEPGRKPIGNVVINWNHSLTRGLIACGIFNQTKWVDLVKYNNVAGTIAGGTPTAKPKAGSYGVDYDSISDAQGLIEDSADLTSDTTFVFVRSPNDTTNRASSAWGINDGGTTTKRFHCHLPFSNTIVYFDYGGQSGGVTRIQWTGYTKVANKIEIWVFLVRGTRMAIWLDGVEISFDAGTTASRTVGTADFHINEGSVTDGDLQTVYAAYLYKRGLLDNEIKEITSNIYQFLIPA